MKNRFFKLPQRVQIAAWICLGFLFFMIWDQAHWWSRSTEYSFGFLVPLFVGYVLFDRWAEIKAYLLGTLSAEPVSAKASPKATFGKLEPSRSSPLEKFMGLLFAAALIGGFMSFLLGALYRAGAGPQAPASLLIAWGVATILLAMVYLNSNSDARGHALTLRERLDLTALFVFPALIWLISAPMLDFLHKGISLFLLNKVIAVVFFFFDLLGLPMSREGNVLVMPKGNVGVVDACSGIRSQMACLFTGSFLAAVFLQKLWKKIFLVGMAMFLAFVFNIMRSLFLTAWAYRNGSESLSGTVHDVTGYAVLGLTCLGLISLLPLFNLSFTLEDDGALE